MPSVKGNPRGRAKNEASVSKSCVKICYRLISLIVAGALCFFVYVGARKSSFYVFYLHPLFMGLFVLVAIPEVLGTIHNVKQAKQNFAKKDAFVTKHQIAAGCAATCWFFGAVAIVLTTMRMQGAKAPPSYHSIAGGVCGSAVVLQMSLGALLKYVISRTSAARKYFVAIHGLFSLIITLGSMAAFVLGVMNTSAGKELFPSDLLRLGFACSPIVLFSLAVLS